MALLISHNSREVVHNFVSCTCWMRLNSPLKQSWASLFFHCSYFPQLPITWHRRLKSSRGIQLFQVAWVPLLWIRICVINPGQVRNLFDFNNVTCLEQLVLYCVLIQQGIQQLYAYLISFWHIPLDKEAYYMTANQICCLMSLFSNGLCPQGTSILYQLHLQLLLTTWTQGIWHFHSWLLNRSQHCSLLGCNFQNQVRFDSISKWIFKFFHNFPNLYMILCSTYIFMFLFTDCWVWGFWERVFLVSSHIFSWAQTLKHLNFVCIVPLQGRPLSIPDQVLCCNRKSTASWSRHRSSFPFPQPLWDSSALLCSVLGFSVRATHRGT